MVNVLIATQPDDMHAAYVQLALEKKGHRGILWYTADYPTQQTHSLAFSNKHIKWSSTGIDEELNNTVCDVVWYRRLTKPILPEYLHPDDVENAQKENAMFFQSIWHMVAKNAVWINSIESRQTSNYKTCQLRVAAEVGLKFPTTLVSNDPKKIKEFVGENEKQGIIFKTLTPMTWFGEEDTRLLYTKKITLDQLSSDKMLQSVPGIFQLHIKKAYELRITYFGGYYVAVKINSQIHPKGMMDWRYAPTHELTLERVKLPEAIDKQCQALMKRLGLVFGCIDMIVTPEDEYYFLEINEQGQFLWIEEVNPEIPMLDIFTDYLIQTGNYNPAKKSLPSLTMQEVKDEAILVIDNAVKYHKGSSMLMANKKSY